MSYQTLVRAREWFYKSAVQGSAEAQHYRGRCYFDGHGVAWGLKQAFG